MKTMLFLLVFIAFCLAVLVVSLMGIIRDNKAIKEKEKILAALKAK